MNKIILAILLIFLCCFIPALGQDAEIETYTSGDWEYTENDTGITLTKFSGEPTEHMEIPAELDGKTVTQMGRDLFRNDSVLQSVIIPDGITAIGSNAFNGCTALTDVHLPNTLKRVDAGVFQYCTALERIDVPFSVSQIMASAFADCISLREVTLLSVIAIGDSAFDDCISLEKVTVSRKVTSVGAYAFRDTPWLEAQDEEEFVFMGKGVLIRWNGSGSEVEIPYGTVMVSNAFGESPQLEKVTLPDTVIQIGSSAFRDAVSLREVNMPQYLEAIGASAFEGCRSLESILLPQTVRSIGPNAFQYCESLRSIVIPARVTAIPGNAFAECASLTDAVIPESVENIHARTFQNSSKVRLQVMPGSFAESFAQENEIPYEYMMKEEDGFVFSVSESGAEIVRYTGSLRDVEIPGAVSGLPVTAVGEGVFQNNSRVHRVIIPQTVKSIGDWAFSYMANLEAVQLPEGLETIGDHVFTGSPALKEIRMPLTLNAMGSAPFDAETETMICAMPESAAAGMLEESGYTAAPFESCAEDAEVMALWAELNMAGAETGDACEGVVPVSAAVSGGSSAGISMFRVPEGIAKVDADMLSSFTGDVFLVIPASVTEISEDILEGRTLTIVSVSGSAAETFAVEHGLKFLLRARFQINM